MYLEGWTELYLVKRNIKGYDLDKLVDRDLRGDVLDVQLVLLDQSVQGKSIKPDGIITIHCLFVSCWSFSHLPKLESDS